MNNQYYQQVKTVYFHYEIISLIFCFLLLNNYKLLFCLCLLLTVYGFIKHKESYELRLSCPLTLVAAVVFVVGSVFYIAGCFHQEKNYLSIVGKTDHVFIPKEYEKNTMASIASIYETEQRLAGCTVTVECYQEITYLKVPLIDFQIKIYSPSIDNMYKQAQGTNDYTNLYRYLHQAILGFESAGRDAKETTLDINNQEVSLINLQEFMLYGDTHTYTIQIESVGDDIHNNVLVDGTSVYTAVIEMPAVKKDQQPTQPSTNRKPSSGDSSGYKKEDYYDVDDFYDDTYGDFEDYEEAEDYYYEYVE